MKLSEVVQTHLYNVPAEQAFEWVKTGLWNKSQFTLYMVSVKEYHHNQGWKEGFFGEGK